MSKFTKTPSADDPAPADAPNVPADAAILAMNIRKHKQAVETLDAGMSVLFKAQRNIIEKMKR